VWDVESRREVRTLEGHSSSVWGVALSADCKRAISSSDDRTLKVWNLESGVSVATFTCDFPTRCCTIHGTQTILAGDESGRVHFLSLEL
jgi:WD40 repeat protein